MNDQVHKLFNEAKILAIKSKNPHGRSKYPVKLKKIIFSLTNDHGVRPKDILAFVPISAHSIRTWSYIKKPRATFNKIKISEPKVSALKKIKVKNRKYLQVQILILSAQVLLLAWQLSRY